MIYSKLLCKNKFDFFELVIFTFRMSSIGFMKKDKKNPLRFLGVFRDSAINFSGISNLLARFSKFAICLLIIIISS